MRFEASSPFVRPENNIPRSPTRETLIDRFYGTPGSEILTSLGEVEETGDTPTEEGTILTQAEEAQSQRWERARACFRYAEETADMIAPERTQSRLAAMKFEARRIVIEAMSEVGLPPHHQLKRISEDLEEANNMELLAGAKVVTAAARFAAGQIEEAERTYETFSDQVGINRLRLHIQFALIEMKRNKANPTWLPTVIDRFRSATAQHSRGRDFQLYRSFLDIAAIAQHLLANIDDLFKTYEDVFEDLGLSSISETGKAFFRLGCAEIEAGRYDVIDKKIYFHMESDLQAELHARIAERTKRTQPDVAKRNLKKAKTDMERSATEHSIQAFLKAIQGMPDAKDGIEAMEKVATQEYTDESVIRWDDRNLALAALIEAYVAIGHQANAKRLLEDLSRRVDEYDEIFRQNPRIPGQIEVRTAYAQGLHAIGEDGHAPLKRLGEMMLNEDGELSEDVHHIDTDEMLRYADAQIALGMNPQSFLSALKRQRLEKRTRERRTFNEDFLEILKREIAWAQQEAHNMLQI